MSAGRRRASGCLVVLLVALTTTAGGSVGSGGSGGAVTAEVVTAPRDGEPRRETTTPALSAPAAPSIPTDPSLATDPSSAVVLAPSRPLTIEIPAIDVSSELMELGLMSDGTLEVPPGAFPAGWFTGAPTPGELGPAVIAGHIDWVTGPGVFARLGSLEVGDDIEVRRADGGVAVFRTVEVARYPKDRFPTDLVYGDIDHAGLRVISCGGAFDPSTGHYEDNIVAFARLVA